MWVCMHHSTHNLRSTHARTRRQEFGHPGAGHRAKWKCSALTRDAQEALAMRDIHIAADDYRALVATSLRMLGDARLADLLGNQITRKWALKRLKKICNQKAISWVAAY